MPRCSSESECSSMLSPVSPISPITNGLSSWYDRLRNNPATLYDATSKTGSQLSIERKVTSKESDEIDEDKPKHTETKREIAEIVTVSSEEEIQSLIGHWISQIKSEDFISKHGNVELSPINQRICVRSDPYHGFSWETRTRFQYSFDGSLDEEEKFHGEGIVEFEDGGDIMASWNHGDKDGKFSSSCPNEGIKLLRGTYKRGKMFGIGKIVYDRYSIEGHFRDGCLHGLVKIRDSRTFLVGRFLNGKPEGVWWQLFQFGGCLVGELDPEDHLSITSDNCMYLYPDNVTALVGQFDKSRLVAARETSVVEASLEKGSCNIR